MLQLVKYYRNIENHLCEIEKAEAGCWISVINPTETEISDLEDDLGIDRDYVRAALDEEEPSRIEADDGVTLIVVDYPVAETDNNPDRTLLYSTTPMSIIITDKNVVTVSAKENSVVEDISKGRCEGDTDKSQDAFRIHDTASYRGKIFAVPETDRQDTELR